MVKPKVLFLGEIDHAHDEVSRIATFADIVKPKATTREDFLAEARSGAFDGAVVAYRTFGSFTFTGMIDEEVINTLPKSLRFFCHCGAGYDQISVPALESRDPPILLSNTPTAVDDSTADTAVFLILGCLRNFPTSLSALRRGDWRGQPPPALGHDPRGKTLGILGMGGIGRNLAAKVAPFGMKVIYHNRKPLDQTLEPEGSRWVDFDALLAESDVLSLNLPLNDKTRHIISATALSKCRRGVIIINTARGAVMDESALVAALESGQAGGAGLDVYEHEPKVHSGLVDNERVLLLPHMGTWSVETQDQMERQALANVDSALREGVLRDVVPEMKELAGKHK